MGRDSFARYGSRTVIPYKLCWLFPVNPHILRANSKCINEGKMSRAPTKPKTRSTIKATGKQPPVSPVNGSAPEPSTSKNPAVVNAAQSVILGPVMRKKELIDLVVERTGQKKRDVKPAVESMLLVLGEALADNRELILPPFGRLKVKRSKILSDGRVMVAKIRQSDKNSRIPAVKPTETTE